MKKITKQDETIEKVLAALRLISLEEKIEVFSNELFVKVSDLYRFMVFEYYDTKYYESTHKHI